MVSDREPPYGPVPPSAPRRPGADVALEPGVIRELKGARREPRARLGGPREPQLGKAPVKPKSAKKKPRKKRSLFDLLWN